MIGIGIDTRSPAMLKACERLFVVTFASRWKYSDIHHVAVTNAKGKAESYTVFKFGRRVAARGLEVVLRKTDKKKPADFLANMYRLPIVSPRVRQVFEALRVRNVEYIPVRFVGTSVPRERYSLVNVLVKRDIVDWRKTRFTTFVPDDPKGVIRSIESLVLRERRIPRATIFYMERTHSLVVKKPLAEAIAGAQLTGVALREIMNFDFRTG